MIWRRITILCLGLLLQIDSVKAELLAGRVTAIADGDTLTILVANRPVKVRLANIDAPERRQEFGTKAKQSLAQLCWNKAATVEVQNIDRYKRAVATVICEDVNANRAQVERGMAWVYTKYNKDRSLPSVEEQARQQHRGLWAGNQPVAPWTWRRLGRQ